ncbi:DNA polymerase III subunit epsilon [Meridianimarinicoccus roseus]|uniref:DNA-directed DNA polymerase n=1 Tax=Meridianimarinicoccus roseus TaxID=2072018 RepID=A0A2V2LFA5_9RHOB|nr:exonuclease domain-containing protein [Meridianimarinicoccus roseus]PWR04105.1 DNA polymerase III subunit epsilon [Meridianimarinicoccus roseus]
MLTGLSLRLRVFLFFAALALGSDALIAGGLWFAATRADPAQPTAALMTGGIIAAFLVTGLVLAIWRLFDENVAKAIERLSSELRARTHGHVATGIDTAPARYLGDLAPAAGAVVSTLSSARDELDLTIAEQTRRLQEQTAQLSALLSDVQAGLILCSSAHRVVFYNGPAVGLLQGSGRPRLDRSVFDLLRKAPIQRTYQRLLDTEDNDAELLVSTTGCGRVIAAHMRLVSGALGIGSVPGYVLTLRDISADLRLHTERERLLSDMVGALRAPAAGLRALLDMAEDGRDNDPALAADIRREALDLTATVQDIAARHDAQEDTWWPMQDVRASHLIDALRGQLGDGGPTISAPTVFLRLHCDAFALVNLLAALIERVVDEGLAQAFTIDVTDDSPGALITIGWQGTPMAMDVLQAELDEPVRDSPLAVTGREILDFHNTDIWPERLPEGRAALVLPLREAERTTPINLAADKIAERPTVFDFDLLNRVPDGSKQGKRLRELTYVVFDTETTGLDPKGGDEIVQIAAVRLVNGKLVEGETLDQLVDPERPIPAASTKVHGIDDAMVKGAPKIDEVGARFHRICEHAVLIAHNAPFDLAFFHKQADRIGARFDHPVFDTVLLSAILFGQGETHTLDALADRFGIVIPEEARHTALGDTIATAEVFQRMIPMLEARGLDTFDAVLDAMQKNSRLMREMKARIG